MLFRQVTQEGARSLCNRVIARAESDDIVELLWHLDLLTQPGRPCRLEEETSGTQEPTVEQQHVAQHLCWSYAINGSLHGRDKCWTNVASTPTPVLPLSALVPCHVSLDVEHARNESRSLAGERARCSSGLPKGSLRRYDGAKCAGLPASTMQSHPCEDARFRLVRHRLLTIVVGEGQCCRKKTRQIDPRRCTVGTPSLHRFAVWPRHVLLPL